MNRTLNAVRMQLVNKDTWVWVPLIVLGGTIVVNVAIWMILTTSNVDATIITGGAQAPLWYFLAVGVQSMTLTFPFSQAMSVTRRDFYLGTLLTAALASAALSAIFILGGLFELATDGWGMNSFMFHLPWVWESGAFGAALFFFVMTMLFFIVGFWYATVWKRFGALGLTVAIIGVVLAFLGALWLIAYNDSWGPVFEWFAGIGALGLAGWGAALAALLALGSYRTLRRTVP